VTGPPHPPAVDGRAADGVLAALLNLAELDVRRDQSAARAYVLFTQARAALRRCWTPQSGFRPLLTAYRAAAAASMAARGRAGPYNDTSCDRHIELLVARDGDLATWAARYLPLRARSQRSGEAPRPIDILPGYAFVALSIHDHLLTGRIEPGDTGETLHSFLAEVALAETGPAQQTASARRTEDRTFGSHS
jgi:hypothetical protein